MATRTVGQRPQRNTADPAAWPDAGDIGLLKPQAATRGGDGEAYGHIVGSVEKATEERSQLHIPGNMVTVYDTKRVRSQMRERGKRM